MNIAPTFQQWQYDAIVRAFKNWQASNHSLTGGNCSGVTFTGFTKNPYDGSNLFGTYRVEVENVPAGRDCANMTPFVCSSNNRLCGARIKLGEPNIHNNAHNLTHTAAHEIGHTIGLDNCTAYCSNVSLMGGGLNNCAGLADNADLVSPSACDNSQVRKHYCPEPTPTPLGNCEPPPLGRPPVMQECPEPFYPCDYRYEMWNTMWCRCTCRSLSPVLLDVRGDGVITNRDAVFDSLRLWQDTDHNGVSEAWELHALPALGLESVRLDYKEAKRTDGHGNQFRYRAKVGDARGAQLGRWAWDVFLVEGP